MALKTPVALLLFNRPDVTAQVFAAIREAEPETLLLIADGPRSQDEKSKCDAARRIVSDVNWNCRVLKNFADSNLGCGKRAATGFTWVFSEVEEAIILEDDTLPLPSFFRFCEQLLDRYRSEPRVMHINGANLQADKIDCPARYYFSKYTHSWGWASWRRAWKHYDYQMSAWPDFEKRNELKALCSDPTELAYWKDVFSKMHQDPMAIDTWDYQWLFACWANKGLVVTPAANMVQNLGFNRPDSTHTYGENPFAAVHTEDIWRIGSVPSLEANKAADRYEFDYAYGGAEIRRNNTFPRRLRRQLGAVKRALFKRQGSL